jgi:hypothetical protein
MPCGRPLKCDVQQTSLAESAAQGNPDVTQGNQLVKTLLPGDGADYSEVLQALRTYNGTLKAEL